MAARRDVPRRDCETIHRVFARRRPVMCAADLMNLRILFSLLSLSCLGAGCASSLPSSDRAAADQRDTWSVRMADSVLARNPDPTTLERADPKTPPKWSYATAFEVQAIGELGARTGDKRYLDYARQFMQAFVDDHGKIVSPTYKPDAAKLDDIEPGRLLLLLYRQTGEQPWLTAAGELVDQLRRQQPRNADGGFWHKRTYPHQMWLDGIYMACPFMAEYARTSGDAQWADEAARQILLIGTLTRDPRTGLYTHGYDDSRAELWADKETGRSPCVWGRAVGWYVMGIVDTLEALPANHPKRAALLDVLRDLADGIARTQDASSGVWYQVLDQPGREGNYLESSASCMFVYALAKAVRLRYLGAPYDDVARRGYRGVIDRFVKLDPQGSTISLTDTCQVAGLGGTPYRDGSFGYYVNERRSTNDAKGIAPFILASIEMETVAAARR
jgi:unsaturated rhamnogalacturonyl hydrolase